MIDSMASFIGMKGRLAQLVARMLSMHEVAGSIPAMSILLRILLPRLGLLYLPGFLAHQSNI